ncbi:MAG: zinc ABC transporter substrate-binding protein [Candidatus Nezhaarchaeota archaeon]|nr:zinc ABC transporter substrate-binding protein [Candidatus Nezhaarchaeota archaeon]
MARGVGAGLLLIVLFTLMATHAPCAALAEDPASSSKPLVVATTSVLGSIVRDLAGDLVVVEVIASPAACPGHYDVKPGDVEAFRKASLILVHGIEPWVEPLMEASGTKAELVHVRGGWNTPAGLRSRYKDVAKALSEKVGLNVDDRLKACLRAVNGTEEWLRSFARESGFVDKPVVVMKWQRPFVEYLGFKVVAEYGPPERVTPRERESAVANATMWRAALIIDNMQSGVELGESIAKQVGAAHVALTNFPWVQREVRNVTDMMKYNAKLLAKALAEVELKGELMKTKGEVETWRAFSIASGSAAVVLAATTAVLALRMRRASGGG